MARQIPLLFTLLAGMYLFINGVGSKTYKPGERDDLACRFKRNNGKLRDNQGWEEIEDALDKMYEAIKIKDASYHKPCTPHLTYNFQSLNEDGKPVTTEVTEEIGILLEGLEIRAQRYAQGLWGHCADEGKEELLTNISAVKDAIKNAKEEVALCDRYQLLSCHPEYRVCVCMVYNMNFREIASEFWNHTEETKAGYNGTMITESMCVLSFVSECPQIIEGEEKKIRADGKEVKIFCRPENNCVNRGNRKPCITKTGEPNQQQRRKKRSLPEDASDEDGNSLERTEEDDTDSNTQSRMAVNVFLARSSGPAKKFRFKTEITSKQCMCLDEHLVGKGTPVAEKASFVLTFLFLIGVPFWF